MNFSFSLVLVSLSLSFVLCEKCSEALDDAFERNFDMPEKCDDCLILPPRISSTGENWAGFCVGNQIYLFRDWKCRRENNLLNLTEPFVVIANESCEIVWGECDLDKKCLKMFNNDICNGRSGVKNNVDEINFVHGPPTYIPFQHTSWPNTTEETSTIIGITTTDDSTTKPSFAGTTNTISLSTEKISTSSQVPDPPERKFPVERRNCEVNEYFFNGHCYFVKSAYLEKDNGSQIRTPSFNPNSAAICRQQHPKALLLAVETKEENTYIMDLLMSLPVANFVIFTSGVRRRGFSDEWSEWNLYVNQSILPINKTDWYHTYNAFYCIDSCRRTWYLVNKTALVQGQFVYVICERPYNPKSVPSGPHEECLERYRKSGCYNPEKHANFCCGFDETGDLWFSCPNNFTFKSYSNGISCRWYCGWRGFFVQYQPRCRGSYNCEEQYQGNEFIAPATRYAMRGCPSGHWGSLTWYCNWNRTFLGTPDFSFCCPYSDNNGTRMACRDTDSFLNVWMGCPSTIVKKKTACPPGSVLKEALAEWYCQRDGTFYGSTPNYFNCNGSKTVECKKTDRFGTEWMANPGTTVKKNCPPRYTGLCSWYCKESGKFDGPEPDCSRCTADWMNEITDKIKNQTNHEEVMEVMENYTENEDLTIGYAHVLNLTADCVNLFKKQASECNFGIFEKFLKSYSKILRNVAGNPNIWTNFSETNRRNYSEQILETTESAAFAKLEVGNRTDENYNETFAKSQIDGFDFFVAYNPSSGSSFPLENLSESDWHLNIKEINETNSHFAAMGLVMNYSLSSLMFPQGNETEDLQLNAPAITFTVAASRGGEVVTNPNVVVSISFKHTNRTRMPDTLVIRRKLHDGEQPSGVFNSTLCFYYRDSDWTTEGCSVTFTSKDRTNCTCNHLSTIGLLMSIHKYEPNSTLEIVSTVSSGITIISLILALLVFYFFDKVGNDRLLIGKNLCFCLLVGHIMLITVLDKKFFNIPDNICVVFAVLLHYVFMAAFSWMFVEGCHLYRMLVVVFDSGNEYRFIYVLIGYGMPLVVLGVTHIVGLVLQEQPYGQDEVCWLKSPIYVWAFVGPVIVLTSVENGIERDILECLDAARIIQLDDVKTGLCVETPGAKTCLWADLNDNCLMPLWMKAWFSLSALLGITWLFGLAYFNYNEPLVYVFVFFNGLQGFFIFLFRCLLCEQYKTMFLKKIKSWFFKSKLDSHKKFENVKSETKIYAISGTKSESKDSGYDPGFEDVQKCLNEIKKSPEWQPTIRRKPKENSSAVDSDVSLPAMSEAYLRNKMIARNFSVRKSKAKLLAESDNFPELSYHTVYDSNGQLS